ncbi:DUF2569 family protein [Herbaspirillum camelliae]|uniref:DUF2569 family protein n=1 Tax=Herbaspirillum camelliae TaxID=1892903 RepID=UPI000949F9BE|nr:DUF2569 family protein [Herbaspirillum camelliae]
MSQSHIEDNSSHFSPLQGGPPDKPLKGVRGWLLLLVLALLLGDPLGCVWQVIDMHRTQTAYPELLDMSQWQTYRLGMYATLSIWSALSISAGLRLWKDHTPAAVHWARRVLWVTCIVGMAAVYLIVPWIAFGELTAFEVVQAAVGLLLGGAIAFAWTRYLGKSRRVRNTYFSDSLPVQDASR